MNNFYLIDKPLGITSFDILRDLRKKINIKKMGHTGTLDPLATGLILVAVGEYTKLIPFFEKDSKTYEFKVNLDGTTESLDLEKEIEYLPIEIQEKLKKELNIEKINDILKKHFTGKITQIPPKYSALKIGGKKALELVREGVDFEMKEREVEIFYIEVLSFNYPELFLRAKVSAGTYVRTIAADLGKLLGGAGYITYLRRTGIGKLDEKYSILLENFNEKKNLDVNLLFGNENFLDLGEEYLSKINNGLKIKIDLNIKNGTYFLKNKENKITNVVNYTDGILIAIRKI